MSYGLASQVNSDVFKKSAIDRAIAWEIESGKALSEKPQYEYDSWHKAPIHHQEIARLWIRGRRVEQIALLFSSLSKDPQRLVKRVLRHPPIVEHIAQEQELIAQAREEKRRERIEAGDLGFSAIRDLAGGEETPAKVKLDAAKWLAENDPLERYTEKYDEKSDEVHHTDSLTEFFENYEQLKRKRAQKEADTIDVSAEEAQQETESHGTNP